MRSIVFHPCGFHASAVSAARSHVSPHRPRGPTSSTRQQSSCAHPRMHAFRSHLHGELVAGVGSAVDDVEGGNWQDELLISGHVSDVLRRTEGRGCGAEEKKSERGGRKGSPTLQLCVEPPLHLEMFPPDNQLGAALTLHILMLQLPVQIESSRRQLNVATRATRQYTNPTRATLGRMLVTLIAYLIQRNLLCSCAGLADSQGDCQDSICSQLPVRIKRRDGGGGKGGRRRG